MYTVAFLYLRLKQKQQQRPADEYSNKSKHRE